MFEGKSHNSANRSFKNHIRHNHSKSTGFYLGYKGKRSRPVADTLRGQASKHVMKGMSGYEQLRNKVMETAETPIQNVNQVTSAIKKSKINAGL